MEEAIIRNSLRGKFLRNHMLHLENHWALFEQNQRDFSDDLIESHYLNRFNLKLSNLFPTQRVLDSLKYPNLLKDQSMASNQIKTILSQMLLITSWKVINFPSIKLINFSTESLKGADFL